MTPTEFLKSTERTDNYNIPSNLISLITKSPNIAHMIHAANGLSGESGEIQDQMIKHFVYNKPLDVINIKEELGDCLWFIGKMLRQIDSSFEEVMQMNNAKLKIRFPEKFGCDVALNRNLNLERQTLETNANK